MSGIQKKEGNVKKGYHYANILMINWKIQAIFHIKLLYKKHKMDSFIVWHKINGSHEND